MNSSNKLSCTYILSVLILLLFHQTSWGHEPISSYNHLNGCISTIINAFTACSPDHSPDHLLEAPKRLTSPSASIPPINDLKTTLIIGTPDKTPKKVPQENFMS